MTHIYFRGHPDYPDAGEAYCGCPADADTDWVYSDEAGSASCYACLEALAKSGTDAIVQAIRLLESDRETPDEDEYDRE